MLRALDGEELMIGEDDLKREYLMEWGKKYVRTFRYFRFVAKGVMKVMWQEKHWRMFAGMSMSVCAKDDF